MSYLRFLAYLLGAVFGLVAIALILLFTIDLGVFKPLVGFIRFLGDFKAQCLTIKESGAHYVYMGNLGGSVVSLIKSCDTVGVEAEYMGNVWAGDYLTIAEAVKTLIIDDIPALGPHNNNEAKRFVTLIDALYEDNK